MIRPWPVCVLLVVAAAPVRAAPALHLNADAHLEADLLDGFRLQFPHIEILTSAVAGPDDRVVAVASTGAQVRLTVQRASGEVLLTRVLDAGPALASTCALVVDRFLTETHWSPAGPRDLPGPPPHGPSAPDNARRTFVLGLGASYVRGVDSDSSGAGPEVSLWLRRSQWLFGLRGGVRFLADREIVAADPLLGPVNLGKLSAGAASLEASAGPCVGRGTFGCTSLVAGGVITWARSAGDDLYRQQGVVGVQPTAGLSVLGAFGGLPWDLQVHGEIVGRLRLGSTRVEVEGVGEVLRAPTFEVAVTLGLGYAFR